MPLLDIKALKNWFLKNKREFPWRKDPTPYKIWISEVMLQQTQASVVLPYFIQWMQQFPTLEALALAPFEKVMKAWEGLGYYSRARHLHAAAKQLLASYGGKIPCDKDALLQIKGLGPYTVGAILSFAFHQKSAAVDGNVSRVISRLFLVDEEISKPSVQKKLIQITENLLPSNEPWVVMEALIELGARICKRRPLCQECPLSNTCAAFRLQVAHLFPKKRCYASITSLKREVVILVSQRKVLIKKEEKGKIMADLYEFPYFEGIEKENLGKIIQEEIGLKAKLVKLLSSVSHRFTRYEADLSPSLWRVEGEKEVKNYEWRSFKEANDLPFSAGHRRILKNLQKEVYEYSAYGKL
jgi:A/G-specific adenine glycosylase